MKNSEISVQLYLTRKFQPYDKVFEFLKNSGIKNIELFNLENFDEIEIQDSLKKNELSALSTHIGFSTLKDTNKIIDKIKYLNIKHAIVPAPREIPGKEFKDFFAINENQWEEYGKELSSYVDVFEKNELTLGYHNHSYEFVPLPSGKLPIECMMDHNERLKLEIDLGWAIAGGADPLKWIKKYSNKIIACHLKDFYSKDQDMLDHSNQTPIGEGFIDWDSLITSIKETPCEIFAIEHDDPKDYKEYINKSLNYLEKI